MAVAVQSLIYFLLARIEEDEGTASLAEGEPIYPRRGPFAPTRVLAECGAKRRIVEMHFQRVVDAPSDDGAGRVALSFPADVDGCVRCANGEGPCPTLRVLALPYADHPNYRQEWRP